MATTRHSTEGQLLQTATNAYSHPAVPLTETSDRNTEKIAYESQHRSEIARIEAKQREILEQIKAVAAEKERLEKFLEILNTSQTDDKDQDTSDEE
jgi:anti-sigma factor ChrR (cupin superfamily)